MNQIDLQNQTAIVTGGARGIGYVIVERLLASGARCYLWDVDGPALEEAAANLSGKGGVLTTVVDLTKADAVQGATAAAIKQFGQIDILVNNAGIAGTSGKTWELPPDEWREVIEVDLLGVFHCCRSVVPKMLDQGYGRIVNIASIAGKEGTPNASHQSAAKAGVIALTKSLGKELARTGVIVNCVTPSVIETDVLKELTQKQVDFMLSKIPMGRFGQKEEVAALVAWLCSAECSFSTGAVFDLSGGRATY